ncbi:Transcriptional regulator, AraC family [Leptospira biflexa serovar Patoc strain 'Patoc 1 (Ames)']|uniref:HTH araC/xylS-type domain-containing protein n=1 Tax=Leptospira biflexa serovar Patoc (strain Patoc 1 / ATCC 23582 / Paris) TaxID=456481 RepID=B0SNC8_LEPBP|nr:helix-turn-helix domain-containing protein [Leptospira biflexa]ABZ95210.1 Transcriptional regulator, AraC family [Leptospira biflexa serovar Patoc strain 'Patoc 1 (Ames)']ABZ98895.1 Hypothetical protein; putative membrane protein [Leptospira biflexa serovar Patoc strain 'Patoc 1 (Paris)']
MNLIPIVGAVVSFLLAISYWIESIQKEIGKNKNYFQLVFHDSPPIFLFLSVTVLLLHIYCELTNQIHSIPFFYGIHVPSIFLIGPLSYLFFEEMSGETFFKIRFLHFIPSIWCLFLVYSFKPDGYQLSTLTSDHPNLKSFTDWINFLLGFGVVSILIYILMILVRVLRWKLQSKGKIESSFHPFLFLLIYSLFVIVLFVLAQLAFMDLFLPACFAFTLLLVTLLIVRMNFRDYLGHFKAEIRDARYKESRLKGVDIPMVLQRMEELMKLDRLYLNDRLTLTSLAKRLEINTHQLSEILNTKLGCSFRNYINQFRLLEAEKMLLEKREMTILNIIYASGFNSKSSFHKLFQDRYGVSPQIYRSKSK